MMRTLINVFDPLYEHDHGVVQGRSVLFTWVTDETNPRDRKKHADRCQKQIPNSTILRNNHVF